MDGFQEVGMPRNQHLRSLQLKCSSKLRTCWLLQDLTQHMSLIVTLSLGLPREQFLQVRLGSPHMPSSAWQHLEKASLVFIIGTSPISSTEEELKPLIFRTSFPATSVFRRHSTFGATASCHPAEGPRCWSVWSQVVLYIGGDAGGWSRWSAYCGGLLAMGSDLTGVSLIITDVLFSTSTAI